MSIKIAIFHESVYVTLYTQQLSRGIKPQQQQKGVEHQTSTDGQ